MSEKKDGKLDEAQIREIMAFIEDPSLESPDVVKDKNALELGRIYELEEEYLVIMPPNLALRMPKSSGAGLEDIRHQVISMVAYHTKVAGEKSSG